MEIAEIGLMIVNMEQELFSNKKAKEYLTENEISFLSNCTF